MRIKRAVLMLWVLSGMRMVEWGCKCSRSLLGKGHLTRLSQRLDCDGLVPRRARRKWRRRRDVSRVSDPGERRTEGASTARLG